MAELAVRMKRYARIVAVNIGVTLLLIAIVEGTATTRSAAGFLTSNAQGFREDHEIRPEPASGRGLTSFSSVPFVVMLPFGMVLACAAAAGRGQAHRVRRLMPGKTEVAAPPGRQVLAVLLGSGAIGVFLGIMWRPAWQDALEPAQVLAGVVRYPPDNPVYLYSIRTWTVLHQVLAPLLAAGVSEHALTLALSGVMGMVSFQALGMVVLALSHDTSLAILSPAFVLLTGTAFGGVTYPVALLGVPWTYGTIAMSYLLLTAGLIGAGQLRWGATLLGFAPAIHATVGGLALVIVALAVLFDSPRTRRAAARVWPYFVTGAAAAGLSFVIHQLQTGDGEPALLTRLSDWGQHWDEHRQPFRLYGPRALATYFGAGVAALWLWPFRRDVPDHARVLLRILVTAAVVGGALSVSYWMVPPAVPSVIASLMPSRLLNLNVLSCMAVLLGLSARYRSSRSIQAGLAVLVWTLLALAAVFAPTDEGTVRAMIGWAGMGVFGLLLVLVAWRKRRDLSPSAVPTRHLTRLRLATTGPMAAAVVGVAVIACVRHPITIGELGNPATDPVLTAAAHRPGLLLTAGSIHLAQLLTRRPVLLDGGALDGLAYVPEAAPVMDTILRRVYGTTLLDVQQTHVGQLNDDASRALWEARTRDEWTEIGAEFGVTDVLAWAGWRLQLPVVASNADFSLYAMPPPSKSGRRHESIADADKQ